MKKKEHVANLQDTIKGLECCSQTQMKCYSCPYDDFSSAEVDCFHMLIMDARGFLLDKLADSESQSVNHSTLSIQSIGDQRIIPLHEKML